MIDFILSLFFPNKCPYCSKVITRKLNECNDCRLQFPKNSRTKILPSGEICIAPFVYDSNVRQAIINYKFNGLRNNSKSFSNALYNAVETKYKDIDFSVVCCVPLSKERLNERGFNQSETVARNIAKRFNKPYENLIIKIKNNKEQHSLSAEERVKNVIGVYSVTDKEKVKNKTILLIDDILTTGNTLSECCKILKESDAKKVICASIAITA